MSMSQSFRNQIYTLACLIPRGKVATYGQLARIANHPKAARAVGMFMKTNPFAPVVPCHRVVASDGSLCGYSAGLGIVTKKKMLISEGVKFNGNKVNLSKSLWDN
jgi:O-6-methylguanine DNA methyltransferase